MRKRLAAWLGHRLRCPMALTFDQINEFVRQRWTTPACPRCASNEWLFGPAEAILGVIPIGNAELNNVVGAPQNLPVVWANCKVCGHVTFIAAKVIERWLLDKNAHNP